MKELRNPDVYCQNCDTIVKRHPEFIQAFETHRFEPYMKKKSAFSQFFIGLKGTGSPFHCANVHNMFIMVDGKKEWYTEGRK